MKVEEEQNMYTFLGCILRILIQYFAVLWFASGEPSIMSGAGSIVVLLVLGVTASTIAIVDETRQVHGAAANADGLAEAFREVAGCVTPRVIMPQQRNLYFLIRGSSFILRKTRNANMPYFRRSRTTRGLQGRYGNSLK